MASGTHRGTAEPPQTLVLTPSTLERLIQLQGASAALRQAKGLLEEAQSELFQPLLQKTEPADFTAAFGNLAYKYAPVRLYALSLIVGVLGPVNFTQKYFALLGKALQSMVASGAQYGLNAKDLELAFNRYLSSAIKLVRVAPHLGSVLPTQLSHLLRAATEVDFGLTSLALIFDGSIKTKLWVILETFKLTSSALTDYEQAVNELSQSVPTAPGLSGSLQIEGDLDRAFEELRQHRSVKRRPQ